MNYTSNSELKKYLSNAVYLVIIIFILLLYYEYIFKRNQVIIKTQIENQHISDMQMKTMLFDNVISKYIQGAKSISSRSSIRSKIIDYENNKISLDSLIHFSKLKYKDGIKALENVIWARRYIHSKIILEEGECKIPYIDSLITNINHSAVKTYIYKNDSIFRSIVTSPIFHDDLVIGHDIICFNNINALEKIADKNIEFNIKNNYSKTPNQLIYTDTTAICYINSEHINACYQFIISRNLLYHDLNIFYKQQSIVSLLILLSLGLIFFIFHRKKQLVSLQKSEYFESLAAQKTEKLNKTVTQLLELNKQKDESEKRFKTIFEDNRSIMLIINPQNFQIENANNAALKFYGYKWEELTKLKIYDLNTLQKDIIKHEVNTVVINKKAYFNFKHRLSNGNIRDVEVYSSPVKFDNEIKLISVIHDITERKLYREKIEKLNIDLSDSIQKHKLLEDKLKTIVDMSPIAIIMSTGIEQKTEYINPVFIKLLGYTQDDIPSIPDLWSIAIPDKELSKNVSEEWNKRVKKAFVNKTKIKPIEIEVTCKDASKKYIKWGYIATGIQNWAFGLDLTELRAAETNLRKAKQKVEDDALLLKELNATKDKFFKIVAHDLKSPFNTILGFSSTLLQNINEFSHEEIIQYIKIIDDTAKNTFSLLENLLKWSQTIAGKTIYKPNYLKAEDVIKNTIQQLRTVASAKNITIEFDSVKNLKVFADENMLNTILRNLINNSIKFTPEGGKIEINALKNHSYIVFVIKDNGIGMTQDVVEKLFKIEEKVSTKGTNNESGTGLGLLLANEFVKKHNGIIDVESKKEKGSIFKIQLPLH